MEQVQATMAGNIWKIECNEGDQVKTGETIVILESMKMEIPIEATIDGIVDTIHLKEGDFVNEGDVIISIKS